MAQTRRSLIIVACALSLSVVSWTIGTNSAIGSTKGLQSSAEISPPREASALIPNLVSVGQASLRFFGLLVYDAHLYAIADTRAQDLLNTSFALELTYRMRFTGESIAKKSIEEIKRLGLGSSAQHESWLEQMKGTFPDVDRGDRIMGVQLAGRGAIFFHNGKPLKEINDPVFSDAFFRIWLDRQTSEPGLRTSLLSGLNR